MTVTRRSYNAVMNTSGTSTTDITVGVPTDTAEGELMLAITSQPTGTPTGTGPDGFELIGSYVDTTVQQSNLYRRIATDAEPANYTWTFTQSSTCGVVLVTFVGAHDILHFDANVTGTDSTPSSRRLDACRDAIAYNVLCWRDGASNTVTVNQGSEEFDVVSSNTGATIFRGITAALYGPGVAGIDDIVNIGDALPGTTWTMSGGAITGAIAWNIFIDNKAPDTEPWSATNGDFDVDLKLDNIEVNDLGGITTVFRGDVTGEVSAFFENGENPPGEVTENLADGLASTKWLDFADASFVTYDFGASNAKTIKRYRLTSANDAIDRDPMDWTLEGSNNNVDFTVIDTRQNIGFANRGETQEFNVTTPGEYRYYKLNISSNRGPSTATSTQLAEFRLSTHSVWEDVTTYVQEDQKIRITRGFQGSSGRHDFSRAYCTFKNTDGRFSVKNQSGAYFGSLQRNTEMRISKAYGTKSLQLQGAVRLEGTNMCGDAIRCPLTDVLQITGDIDVRMDLHPESWRDEQMLIGIASAQSDPTDPKASWSLHLDSDGRLNWLHSPAAGGTVSYLSTQAVPNLGRQIVRVTIDVDNGASGSTATFYTATADSTDWIQLGDPVTNTGTTDLSYTGGALSIGHVSSKDERGIHGRVFAVVVAEGINGTARAFPDFTTATNGAHEYEDPQGNRWITINNAVISNRNYRFHGEVAEWPLFWDPTGNWVEVSATGAGVQKRLERGNSEESAFYRHHTKGVIPDPGAFERFAEPKAYWPCEDETEAIRIASGLPGKPHMEIYGTPEFASFSDFQGSKSLPKLANAKFGGRVTGNSSGYADIRWIMHVPTSITNGSVIMQCYGTGIVRRWELEYNAVDTWILRGYDEDDTGAIFRNTGTFAMATVGEFMYCQMILDNSGTSVDVTIRAWDEFGTSLGEETDNFLLSSVGRIYRININDDGTNEMNEAYVGHIALYDSVDAPDPEAALNAHIYETAADRVKRLCEEEQIEFRHIGSTSQSAFMGHQEASAIFPLLSTNAVSDDGYLTDPLDAFGIEYKSNRALYNQDPHITFSYSSGDLSGELTPTSDDSYIVNDFTASRGNASSARFRLDEGALSVNAPPDGVGPYDQSQSYSFAHEGQCIQMASWQVHKGTLDEERFPRMEVALENLRIAADTAKIEALLTLDIGKRVDITDVPDFLPAEDIRQIVIGYEEWFDNFQHNFKLNCIPERIFEVAEYDSGYHFDVDDTELTQDITAAATSITVDTNNGPVFSGEPKSYPFDMRIDGEVVRVLAWGEDVTDNHLFASNVTGWTTQNCAIAHETNESFVHPDPIAAGSLKMTPDGSLGDANALGPADQMDVVPQNVYRTGTWVFIPAGWADVRTRVNWHDSGGSYLSTSSSTANVVAANTWTWIEQDQTAPASAATGRILVSLIGDPDTTDVAYFWNSKMVPYPPFEGSDQGDSFNRADSTTTPGSTDRGVVEAWTEDLGAWGILSNQAYISAAGNSYMTISGAADFEELSVSIPTWASGDSWLNFRFTDGSNRVRFGGTLAAAAQLQVIDGGATVRTVVADATDFTLAAGDRLRVRATGSVIECFVNDVLALCVSDDTEAGTRVGLQTAVTTTRFEDFYFNTGDTQQSFVVERGVNGAAAAHKTDAKLTMLRAPYRGL